ncbi:MAG: branched-chain amino acid transport system carrier protein [Sedimentibacter sp.]|jgi:LIVCS family branched-chain amino acid:cation transporter|nr:branched-chain amino acid transport system carrier protein [Sedimentibacter sp.]
MNTIKKKDIITCGFALFAIFFGAGNLIFPPYLGVLSGDRWFESMIGFLMTDPVLPVLGVLVTMKLGGRADDLGKRVSPKFAKLIGLVAILTIGPFFAVPRTGATTHEIFVQPLFGADASILITSVIFFAITLWVSINPSKVIDYVGNILTPVLLVILAVIVTKSIIAPPDALVTTGTAGLFANGFKEGYQTMDALGAALMAGIVSTDLIRRGYKDEKTKMKASIGVGLVAFVLLALVYGGLTYAGATVGGHYSASTPRTELLIGMTTLLLGDLGKFALGLAVALACLTTSTGLVSTCGNYFETISNGKLKYKHVVTVATVLSFAISLLGVEKLIAIAVPVLTAIYPVVMVLIILSIFDKKIKYNWTYTGAVVGAFSVSLLEGVGLFGQMTGVAALGNLGKFVQVLPLSQLGFGWIIPSIAGSIIFTLISKYTNMGDVGENYKLSTEVER